jgi:hypothetical protein
MTGTAPVVGPPIDMLEVDKGGFELQIAGTPTGTLSLEGSDQYDPTQGPAAPVNTGIVFVPLAAGAMNPALPAVAGAALSYIGNFTAQALGCRTVRLRYVNASSTGQLNAFLTGQGVN